MAPHLTTKGMYSDSQGSHSPQGIVVWNIAFKSKMAWPLVKDVGTGTTYFNV